MRLQVFNCVQVWSSDSPWHNISLASYLSFRHLIECVLLLVIRFPCRLLHERSYSCTARHKEWWDHCALKYPRPISFQQIVQRHSLQRQLCLTSTLFFYCICLHPVITEEANGALYLVIWLPLAEARVRDRKGRKIDGGMKRQHLIIGGSVLLVNAFQWSVFVIDSSNRKRCMNAQRHYSREETFSMASITTWQRES